MALCSFSHLIAASKHSFAGIKHAWRNEQAFRHEVLLFIPILTLLFLLSPGIMWAIVIIVMWMGVLVVELLNSAIEELFNLVSPEYNIHVKHGKDMASAAIFVMLIINSFLWICMLFSL